MADGPVDGGGQTGLDDFPNVVAGPLVGHRGVGLHGDARRSHTLDAFVGVAYPAAPGDVVVEPGIAVD